uniref:Cytochrome P450 n=1 Tax=Panagrolaimus sp. PS1159 TaxID=55785 RepID=A0AC35FFY9_9BILA
MLWFLGLFFLLLCFYNFYWKRRLLPPGPIPLPLIGNYHEVEANPPGYATFDKWRKKYGEIHTFWLAETPVVSINDFNLIQKYFVKENSDTLAGRMLVGRQMEIQRGGTFGLIFVDGVQWREHRRFALQVFRNFGMGRGLMEEKIQIEISNMFDDINEAFGNSKEITIEPAPLFEITVANIINQLLFGFGYHDKKGKQEFSKVKDCIAKMMRFACSPSINLIYSFYPLRHLPFLKQKFAEFTEVEQFISNYCQKQVEAHKTAMKNSNGRKLDPQDYVEAYLQESANRKDDDFSEKQLKYVIFDMWVAGQETTANTLIFSLLYLLHNPNVQQKIHTELDSVIGSDRRITLADKSSLIYVNAFINEVQRSVNLLPMNLLHKTLNDVQIGNYLIKKDTAIVPQISAVMFDEKIFPEPHKFKPERFIDAKGELKKVEELVPFSIGKRQCLGESLARMELFLFVSNFYNLYKVAPIDPTNLPSLDKIPGVTIQPKHFSCNFIKRF